MRSLFWFGGVGAAAALTHLGVYVFLVAYGVWRELANIVGFGVAFFVSFIGHRHLSFKDATTGVSGSLWRFGLTALAGLACNEIVFVFLLQGLNVTSLLAWFIAVLVAAGQTFVLGRYWAFRA